MLTNTYTTRTDLSTKEVMLLVRVREGLRNGTISDSDFMMQTVWTNQYDDRHNVCGTAGCIGGWMGYFNRVDYHKEHPEFEGSCWNDWGYLPNEFRDHMGEPKFKSLFYPSHWKMYDAKPADGIRAIDNFLAGKALPWAFMRKDGSHAKA